MPLAGGELVTSAGARRIDQEHRAPSASRLTSAPLGEPPAALWKHQGLPGPRMQGHNIILDIRGGHTELCMDHGKHSLWTRAKRHRCVAVITR